MENNKTQVYELKVNKDTFAEALDMAFSLCVNGISIKISPSNKIMVITGFNGADVQTSHQMQVETSSPEREINLSKESVAVIKAMVKYDGLLSLKLYENELEIKVGDNEFVATLKDDITMIDVEQEQPMAVVSVDTKKFIQKIIYSSVAASKEQSFPGINLYFQANELEISALDGYKVSISNLQCSISSGAENIIDKSVYVPINFKDIKILLKEETTYIYIMSKYLCINNGNRIAVITRMDKEYPRASIMKSEESKTICATIEISKKVMQELNSILLVSNTQKKPISLVLEKGSYYFLLEGTKLKMKLSIISQQGEIKAIKFNMTMMQEIISNLGANIILKFEGETKPIWITEKGNTKDRFFMLPCR